MNQVIDQTALDHSGLTPFAARLFGTVVILAPLFLLGSTVGYITDGEEINRGVLGGTIGTWSTFTFAIAFVGILRLAEPRSPRAAAALTAMAITAFVGGNAFNTEGVIVGMFPELTVERIEEMQSENPIALLAYLPWGLFAPVTFVLTGVVLWRTRAVASWSAALFVAGGVLFVASRPTRIEPLAVFADLVIVLAFVPVGWAMLTGARQARLVAAGAQGRRSSQQPG